MKQHISPKQAKLLTEERFYLLFNDLVYRKDWANYHHKKVTIGKLLEVIKWFYDLKVISIDSNWVVHLFERHSVDEVNEGFILKQTQDKELVNALFDGLLWILENKKRTGVNE